MQLLYLNMCNYLRIFLGSIFWNIFSHLYVKFAGIDVENPAVDVTPSLPVVSGFYENAALCERVQVAGISRLKLAKYSSAYRMVVAPSMVIPERLHNKIQICFHK